MDQDGSCYRWAIRQKLLAGDGRRCVGGAGFQGRAGLETLNTAIMDISLPGSGQFNALRRYWSGERRHVACRTLLPESASGEPRIWLALKDAKLEIFREHEIPSVTDPPKPAVPVRGVRSGSTSQSRQSIVDASPHHTRSSLFLSTELQNGHSHLSTFVGDEYHRWMREP